MRPAVIMSQFPPPPAPRRLTRPARALGDWRLIRLAAVSTKMGRNTPLLCVVMVNTTLSGGGQPPPPRKPTRLVGIMSLATGLLCFSVSKIALSSDIDKRIVYRIFFRYPLSDPGIMCSGTPSNIGTCSESRVSAAGYLPRPAENNQLWGIGGLVNRLYLGFYIPHFGGQVHLNMNLSTKMTKKYVTH